jgi:hypothetical protein
VHESRLELARLLLADFDPQICRIYAQPFRIVARIDGRVRNHVPDYLLVMAAGTARLVNVKPAARLEDPKIVEALAWPGVLAEKHGWEYEVWSGADVTVLDNVRFLAGYCRPAWCPPRRWSGPGSACGTASSWRTPRHEVRPALMALLWSGRLTTDLTRSLSGESVLRRPA